MQQSGGLSTLYYRGVFNMKDMMEHATTRELHDLLDMVWEAETMTPTHTELLCAALEELTARGEIAEVTDEEQTAAFEKLMLRIQEMEKNPALIRRLMSCTPENWQRRQDRKRTYFRRAATSVALVAVLFLSNAVALASGRDLFGAISSWTRNAVLFVVGRDAEDTPSKETDGEYLTLKMMLDNLDISVDLPTYVPDGFVFDSLEPEEPDASSKIIAWFSNGDDMFSIRIRPMDSADVSMSETNGEDGSEIYNGSYLIAMNNRRIKAIWYQGIREIQIQGNLTRWQLTEILDSI